MVNWHRLGSSRYESCYVMQTAAVIDETTTPEELLTRLEAVGPNWSFNWELLLAHQYGRCLSPGFVAIDVGANAGAHIAHFIALHAREVHAFEPIPALAEALTKKFTDQPVTIHQVALSNREGTNSFFVNTKTPTESGLKPRGDTDGALLREICIETRLLDTFGIPQAAYIKLDCEGGELNVLAGATITLRSRPLISIEYGAEGYRLYGHRTEALFDWAIANGYVVADLFGLPFRDLAMFRKCVDRFYWDYFILPQEREEELVARLTEGANASLASLSDYRVDSD